MRNLVMLALAAALLAWWLRRERTVTLASGERVLLATDAENAYWRGHYDALAEGGSG